MNDLALLLDALRQSAGDDALWLAMSDCLEERGEGERAELTRLTLWGRTRREAPEDQRKDWGQRQQALLASGALPCTPEVANSVGMRLALIPAGKFLMGSPEDETARSASEGPRHEVEITAPFYLGTDAVTQGQYAEVMGKNPSRHEYGDPNLPVERVTWEEAVEFCRRLSELPGEKERRRLYRLPSEAEWEYSCRARAPVYQTFHCGKSLTSGQANIAGDDCYGGGGGEYRRQTVPVDSFSPNAFGLWQMHGNVAEWCSDWHGNDYYARSPLTDPPGPPKGRGRVTRGGSYRNGWGSCRSAARGKQGPRYKHGDLGFRVVLVLPSE